MREMIQLTVKKLRENRGATAIEYGLLAGLIAIAIVGGATLTGEKLVLLFGKVVAAIP